MTTEEQQLVERLREGTTIRLSETAATYTPPPKLQIEAADTITRLVEERDEARELAQLFSQVSRKPDWIARAAASEAKVAELQEALTRMTRRFELYAGPNDMHAGHHDLELLTAARRALEQSK